MLPGILILAMMTLIGCQSEREGTTDQQRTPAAGERKQWQPGEAATESTDRSPATDSATSSHREDSVIGTYKGHTLYMGPKGGKYYLSSSGNKVYLPRQ